MNRGVAAKLALAARTTSSFPGAFEPAVVRVTRDEEGQVGRRAPATAGADNLFGQFSDASRTSYNVIDGGVLDNIPVARAIHAVAGSPARDSSRRYLLYLDPTPRLGGFDQDQEAKPDLVGTLTGAFGAQGTAESVLDDIEELRRHNDLAARYQALQRTIAAQLVSNDAPFDASAMLGPSNTQRATLEARRIRALLQDPIRALGEDPFPDQTSAAPLVVARPDEAYRPVLEQDALDALESQIAAHMLERLPSSLDDPLSAVDGLGYPTLTRTAMALLEVARAGEMSGQDWGPLKEQLYATHGLSSLMEHVGELFWPVYTSDTDNRPTAGDDDWCTWICRALDARQELLGVFARQKCPDEWAAYRSLHDEVKRLRPDALTGNLRHLLWAELVSVAVTFAEHEDLDLTAAPLYSLIVGNDDIEQALVAYEVATQPLQTISPRPPLPMTFFRVSSAVPSPAADTLFGRQMDARTKLTGNEVMNFAAFYKASWRANDWMWGRLDTVAAMVNMLVRPDELRRRLEVGAISTDEVLELVRRAVTELPSQSDGAAGTVGASAFQRDGLVTEAWQARLDELWRDNETAVRGELDSLLHDGAAEQRLRVLRRTLMERRQLELLCAELPAVVDAATGDQLRVANRALAEAERHESLLEHTTRTEIDAGKRVSTPDKLAQLCKDYKVGSETFADEVGRAGFTELLAHLLVVSWAALNASLKVPGPIKRPTGVVLHTVRSAAVGVVRAPRWAVAVTAAVVVLAIVAALQNGLGPLGRSTAIAILVGLALAASMPAMRRPWLRAGAATAVLASGGYVAWRAWESRSDLSDRLARLDVPTWLAGSPTAAVTSVVLAILAGATTAVVWRWLRPPGDAQPSTRVTLTVLGGLAAVAAVPVACRIWFAESIDAWWLSNVNADSVAAGLALFVAGGVLLVTLRIAASVGPSLYAGVIVAVLTGVLLLRPPGAPSAIVLAAGALAALGVGYFRFGRDPSTTSSATRPGHASASPSTQ